MFKSTVNNEKFIKVIALILGILLEYNKVTWTDLSGTFGPNSASSCSRREIRASYCKIYTLWLKMNLKLNLNRFLSERKMREGKLLFEVG